VVRGSNDGVCENVIKKHYCLLHCVLKSVLQIGTEQDLPYLSLGPGPSNPLKLTILYNF